MKKLKLGWVVLIAFAGCADVDVGEFGSAENLVVGEACDASTPCDSGEFCSIADEASCGAPGVCVALPTCSSSLPPACGCDGNTYNNVCGALGAGNTGIIDGGACGSNPGSGGTCLMGSDCMTGEYCDVTEQAGCGMAGTCKSFGPCSSSLPVACGCDGITYNNRCGAVAAGNSQIVDGSACGAVTPTCSDGIQNQDETGVDCGGAICAACPTCSDGIMNQDETGVDCGGATCAACPSGTACDSGADCMTGEYCDVTAQAACGAPGTCKPWGPCSGSLPQACGCDGNTYNNRCGAVAAGNAQIVDGTACGTVTPTCTDGIQNQDETGVDCGGATCAACPTCSDGIMNQDETGVDCGGATCAACPTCSDGIQNQDETGVDCGGATCAACPTGCTDATDCGTNEYCEMPDQASCGGANGTCQPWDPCNSSLPPVCGCDGITYNNRCGAVSNGQTAMTIGACGA